MTAHVRVQKKCAQAKEEEGEKCERMEKLPWKFNQLK